jgi:hypothetical protein
VRGGGAPIHSGLLETVNPNQWKNWKKERKKERKLETRKENHRQTNEARKPETEKIWAH